MKSCLMVGLVTMRLLLSLMLSLLLAACSTDAHLPTAATCTTDPVGGPAPDLGREDDNPSSPSYGTVIHTEAYRGAVLLVYFANAA